MKNTSKLCVKGQGKVQETTSDGLHYNIRLQIKLIFVTRGRAYIYISACEHRMTIVHGIAVREARGGCATSPPTIRHMHNNQTLAWQRHRDSPKTPDIQHFLPSYLPEMEPFGNLEPSEI